MATDDPTARTGGLPPILSGVELRTNPERGVVELVLLLSPEDATDLGLRLVGAVQALRRAGEAS